MEKENVLEIEYQEVFDRVAVRIKYQNFGVLKRGEFYDEEIEVESFLVPEYIKGDNKLYIQGEEESKDRRIFLIDKEDLKNILEKVNKINQKYGIPKRCRGKRSDKYFSIFGDSEILETTDKNGNIKKVFREDKFYNCESWLYGKEMTLEELKRIAYWEEEDERD